MPCTCRATAARRGSCSAGAHAARDSRATACGVIADVRAQVERVIGAGADAAGAQREARAPARDRRAAAPATAATAMPRLVATARRTARLHARPRAAPPAAPRSPPAAAPRSSARAPLTGCVERQALRVQCLARETRAAALFSAAASPATLPLPAAVDRIADQRQTRHAPDARGSDACVRSRAARAAACARESAPRCENG